MKRQIDSYIETNYKDILSSVKKKIVYFKSTLNPEELISEAYLYVIGIEHDSLDAAVSYFYNFINQELYYPKSHSNRKKVLRSLEYEDNQSLIEIETDVIAAIDIKDFVKKLDRVDQIVWRVMVEKGLIKVRELSEHFNIPETTIYLYRVRITEQFKAYYEDKKRIQWINSND